jgi:hypothetical protein
MDRAAQAPLTASSSTASLCQISCRLGGGRVHLSGMCKSADLPTLIANCRWGFSPTARSHTLTLPNAPFPILRPSRYLPHARGHTIAHSQKRRRHGGGALTHSFSMSCPSSLHRSREVVSRAHLRYTCRSSGSLYRAQLAPHHCRFAIFEEGVVEPGRRSNHYVRLSPNSAGCFS